MSPNKLHETRQRFLCFLADIEHGYTQHHTNNNIPLLRYKIPNNSHFFERLFERTPRTDQLGSLFKKLLENHYCEVLYLVLYKLEDIKKYENKKFTLSISVKYKDIHIPFSVYPTSGGFWLTPLTCLKLNWESNSDETIIINE